ncbi:hypothetical protein EYF80_010999 [Liparis tanakae]|uniref:Uncharacterized protein n=1 Tax=Liparis tanakae TaxID=230148 RepID=A0A4Z2ILB9_9TELE|nr:hypothetical protein EYF80_010999 [Liparis tanakae]
MRSENLSLVSSILPDSFSLVSSMRSWMYSLTGGGVDRPGVLGLDLLSVWRGAAVRLLVFRPAGGRGRQPAGAGGRQRRAEDAAAKRRRWFGDGDARQ